MPKILEKVASKKKKGGKKINGRDGGQNNCT
jgi:hypothetical protein